MGLQLFPKFENEFLAITLISDGHRATVTTTDGHDMVLDEQDTLTDLEAGTYKFFLVHGVLMLRSEY